MGKRKALKFANFEAISRVKGIDFFSKNIIILFMSSLIIFLLVMAVSGVNLHREMDAYSFSFVIAVDSSRSMEANDMLPNRIELAKEIAKGLVDSSPAGTRVGVVSFSGSSYIEQDMTENKDELKDAIGRIKTSTIEGTDVYETVITSSNLLKNEDAKAIILLSDGQINVGSVDDAIKYASEHNVVINTIMMGTEEGGQTAYGISKPDKDALMALAFNTRGNFYNATDRESLSQSFSNAMSLTKKMVSTDLSSYLLLAAILLFLIEQFLANARYSLIP